MAILLEIPFGVTLHFGTLFGSPLIEQYACRVGAAVVGVPFGFGSDKAPFGIVNDFVKGGEGFALTMPLVSALVCWG